MANHGTTTKYREGCKTGIGGRPCAKCRAAVAEQRRRQRAAKADKPRANHQAKPLTTPSSNVVSMPTRPSPPAEPPAPEPGPTVLAVRAELAMLPKAQQRPGIAAMCEAIAWCIDDDDMKAVRATNSRQLQSLLHELQGPRKKSGGRLATVSAMAGRRRAQ